MKEAGEEAHRDQIEAVGTGVDVLMVLVFCADLNLELHLSAMALGVELLIDAG